VAEFDLGETGIYHVGMRRRLLAAREQQFIMAKSHGRYVYEYIRVPTLRVRHNNMNNDHPAVDRLE
jgi:hypothetical protein